MIPNFVRYSSLAYTLVAIYFISIVNMGNRLVLGNILPNGTMHIIFFLIFISSLIIVLKEKVLKKSLLVGYLVLCLFTLPSVLFSEYLDVAFIKYISFFMGLFSLVFISNKIIHAPTINSSFVFFSYRKINRFFLIVSIAIYFLGLGYTVNETGFAGILNHPQAFGVYLVLTIVTELYSLQFIRSKHNYYSYVFILLASIFSFMTESRLSIISIVILLIIYYFSFFKPKKTHLLALLFMLSVGIFVFDDIQNKAEFVISKSGRSSSTGLQALENSRGFLVEASIYNFLENPITGIGFQVSNGKFGSYPMEVERATSLNIPIKAAVEKGVFWTALAEETGVLGILGFAMFITAYFKKLRKKFSTLVIASIFLIGGGESFLYTLGGVGAIAWCTYFMLYIASNSNKDNNLLTS